jgi:F-type H+-transporting ATPase subunit b
VLTIAASSGLSLFLPDTADLLWSTVVLVILIIFFAKFFMPKFNAIFDERAKRIQGRMDEAEKAQAQARKAREEYEDKLARAQQEASHIRDDARAEASHIISDARSRAEATSRQLTENAQKAIDSQRDKAIEQLKSDMGNVATTLAGQILGQKLEDSDVQSDMIDSLISDMEKRGNADKADEKADAHK